MHVVLLIGRPIKVQKLSRVNSPLTLHAVKQAHVYNCVCCNVVYSLCFARRVCTSLKNIWSTHACRPFFYFRSYFIDTSFRLGSFHEKCRGFTLGAVYQVI